MKKILALTILGLFLVAGNAMALNVNPVSSDGDGNNLQDVFNNITVDGDSSVNVYEDALSDEVDSYWNQTATGVSGVTMIVEIAGFANQNAFGIYDSSDPTRMVELFDGSVDVVDNNDDNLFPGGPDDLNSRLSFSIWAGGYVTINGVLQQELFGSSTFGFYLESGDGNTYYSDSALNDGLDMMAAYQGKGDSVLLNHTFDNPLTWTDQEFILAWEDLSNGDWDYNDMVVMVESVEPVPEPGTVLLLGAGLLGLIGFGRKRIKK